MSTVRINNGPAMAPQSSNILVSDSVFVCILPPPKRISALLLVGLMGKIHDAHPFFRSISPERSSLSGTQADAGPGAAPATFHSVRAPSFVPRPASDRDHSWSAPTARQSLPQTTGQDGASPVHARRQSVGPGFDDVSPRSAAPGPPVRVPPHRLSATIPASFPAARTPGG